MIFNDVTKINRFNSDGRSWCWIGNGEHVGPQHVHHVDIQHVHIFETQEISKETCELATHEVIEVSFLCCLPPQANHCN